ncbi:hypothetical protein BD289DRAFT_89730 [Coniella lustricola]|uniref:Uncharacterized protein n=1 Tax=Coniella lustricola TaxID=2025994 RepID=A0A2T3AGW3_9PEZI|nr:hypothetical protein BD289DRAFT_89730 [Coniella lustricola]
MLLKQVDKTRIPAQHRSSNRSTSCSLERQAASLVFLAAAQLQLHRRRSRFLASLQAQREPPNGPVWLAERTPSNELCGRGFGPGRRGRRRRRFARTCENLRGLEGASGRPYKKLMASGVPLEPSLRHKPAVISTTPSQADACGGCNAPGSPSPYLPESCCTKKRNCLRGRLKTRTRLTA